MKKYNEDYGIIEEMLNIVENLERSYSILSLTLRKATIKIDIKDKYLRNLLSLGWKFEEEIDHAHEVVSDILWEARNLDNDTYDQYFYEPEDPAGDEGGTALEISNVS